MIRLLLPLLPFVLYGCTQNVQPDRPQPQLNEVKVINLSDQILTSMRIEVPSTRSKIVCETVSPGGFCAFRFKARPMKGETAQVTWKIGNENWHKLVSPKHVSIPLEWQTVGLHLTLNANGQAQIVAVESD